MAVDFVFQSLHSLELGPVLQPAGEMAVAHSMPSRRRWGISVDSRRQYAQGGRAGAGADDGR